MSQDAYALMLERVETSRLDVTEFRSFITQIRDAEQLRDVRDKVRAVEAYQRTRGESIQNQNDWAEAALWAERRLGVLCAEVAAASKTSGLKAPKKPDETRPAQEAEREPVPEPVVTLRDLGISHKQSSRWQKLAAVPEAEFALHVEAVRQKGERLTTAGAIRATSDAADYDSDEWYTPAPYVGYVREVLGDIDLDPTSCNRAQETVNAKRFFRKEDDARTKRWKGRTFMNPPYTHPLVEELIEKLIAEYDGGNVSAAIVLVNNATETDWCQALLRRFPRCFPDGRISFEQSDGPRVSPRQGQIFFYLGANVERFIEVFSKLGAVGLPAIAGEEVADG